MNLSEAIESLYQVFAAHHRRDAMEACPHCAGREDADVLPRVPLRTMTAEQLGRYAWKAITTWGEPADYRHFLPRLLELAAGGAGAHWPGLELDHIAGKLALADWHTWPEPEQRAIRDYLIALWDAVLASDPATSHLRAEKLLPGIARFEDVTPFLERWERDVSLTSRLQLAELICSSWGDIVNSRGPWREAGRIVRRWLRDPGRRRALEHALAEHVGAREKERFAAAIEAFQWMSAVGAMTTRDL